ncbi:twin transmembrane helix small protein [Rhodoferax sp.]|uniref:twin transmembrane helix small protein n=1 Tax=Rhodoferax sp. TaxID=50421 RepID=UPI0025E5ACD4|nr:twin transmembrane helix small protein [Rhodoferax sp.]MCM2342449.1 twin transmembrane helix small protein [Rhodoferax sp.]
MKYIVIVAFIGILGSLASALVFMMKKDGSDNDRAKSMAKSLALRVGLSILLFTSILAAWWLGLITPTGIP